MSWRPPLPWYDLDDNLDAMFHMNGPTYSTPDGHNQLNDAYRESVLLRLGKKADWQRWWNASIWRAIA